MGIASLENTPIYIGVRDHELGWSVEAFEQELSLQVETLDRSTHTIVRDAFSRLLANIDRAVANIQLDKLCTPEEAASPTPQLVRRLMNHAADFERARQESLRQWTLYQNQGEGETLEWELERSPYGNISTQAQELLFLKKRSGELARLLGARLALTQFLDQADIATAWLRWCRSERGRSAVRTGLLAVKSQHVGTSMLEINICGAIPPYNHLLAGKLTALLVCSPQVAADYRRRYGQAASEIASQLKGEKVVRPAELVYIGTTGLYTAGSSQYNRLRLPAGLLRADALETRFDYLGDTVGYGTSHISDATTAALEAAASDDFIQVNHVFGEGVSPKMRILRWGLDALFREGQRPLSDRMAMHQMQRRVYGVKLAENWKAYLHNQATTPRYIWDETLTPEDGTERIAEFWRTRWLDTRLRYAPALERVEQFRVTELLLSPELTSSTDIDWAYAMFRGGQRTQSEAPPLGRGADQPAASTEEGRQRNLIRDLYRGSSGFADEIPIDDLRRLHANSILDEAIRGHIQARRSVVLTGNPGDGKTHLLRMLADDISALGAVVEQDASAVSNDQIVANWRSAHDQGRPYFLAINESVLFNLAKTYQDFAPLQQARQQVIDAISYDGPPDLPLDEVVVFDLSHRHTLSAGIVNGVLDKLTEPSMLPRCVACPAHGCDLMRNRILLCDQRVRQRFQAVFDRITRRGIHVTMRDLQAFTSFLLFADRDCSALLQQRDEAAFALPQLPYSGMGPLFDAMRKVFDPVAVSHPVYDDQLVNNLFPREDWLTLDVADAGSIEPVAIERFEQRKRAFYYYHRSGEVMLQQAGGDEHAFAEFLAEQNPRRAIRGIIQKLRMFFGRGTGSDQLPVWQSHRYDQSATAPDICGPATGLSRL
jgi:Druantia protein DruA